MHLGGGGWGVACILEDTIPEGETRSRRPQGEQQLSLGPTHPGARTPAQELQKHPDQSQDMSLKSTTRARLGLTLPNSKTRLSSEPPHQRL